MVRVIGWTPSSRRENPEEVSLSQFTVPFQTSPENCRDYPYVRSGHRCFTDNDYFYVFGGYTTEFRNGSIFKELWAMSLATFEWRRYEVDGELPGALASFAIIQTEPFAKSFLCFGGSGTFFGETSSNSLYLLRVNNDDCVVSSRKLDPTGTIPEPIYGHAMCAGEKPGKYYVIGGTHGSTFSLEVHSLTMTINPETSEQEWHFELDAPNQFFMGRYRLEVIYDEVSECLLFFGGGNAMQVFGFDDLPVFDVNSRETREVGTTADPTHGFPVARRCHTLVRHKRNVIILGGIGTPQSPRDEPLLSDVWIFNLDNFCWKKYEHNLPETVFFHDSAVTQDGWLLSFGGAHGSLPGAARNNKLTCAWLEPPSLQRLAIEGLRRSFPKMFSGLYLGNLRPSSIVEIATVFLRPREVEEKEKNIIANTQIKFRETPVRRDTEGHRNLFFLNDADPRKFLFREVDRIQWERREERGICVFVETARPSDKSVRDAWEVLIEGRKRERNSEICEEIDRLVDVWKTVHQDGEIRQRNRVDEDLEIEDLEDLAELAELEALGELEELEGLEQPEQPEQPAQAEEDNGLIRIVANGIMANIPDALRRARAMLRQQRLNQGREDVDINIDEHEIEVIVEVNDPREPREVQNGEDGAPVAGGQRINVHNLQEHIHNLFRRIMQEPHQDNEENPDADES